MLSIYTVTSDSTAAYLVPLVLGWGWLAWAIPTAVSAFVNLWQGKKASDTAKEAAKTQVAGTQAAQKQLDTSYQSAQSALHPWLSTGGQAATTLGSLMGLPTAAPPTVATPLAPTTPTAGPNPILGGRGYDWQRRVPENETTFGYDLMQPGQGRWTSQQGDRIRAERLATIMGGTEDPTSIAAQTQSSYVQMRAPDGTIQRVPAQYTDHYTQLGATVIG